MRCSSGRCVASVRHQPKAVISELPCLCEQGRSVGEGGLLDAIRLSALGNAVLPSTCRAGFLRKEMVYVTL